MIRKIRTEINFINMYWQNAVLFTTKSASTKKTPCDKAWFIYYFIL